MMCFHPIISMKQMSFCIFFRFSQKLWFKMEPVQVYYLLSLLCRLCLLFLLLWCLLPCLSLKEWRHWNALHLCSPSAMSYLLLSYLSCIALYSSLLPSCVYKSILYSYPLLLFYLIYFITLCLYLLCLYCYSWEFLSHFKTFIPFYS